MKKFLLLLFLLTGFLGIAQKQTQSIGFIENKGQIVDQNGKLNSAVKYLLNTNGLNVQLRENGFSYDVYETKKVALTPKEQRMRFSSSSKEKILENQNYKSEYRYHRIDIDFVNANSNVKLLAEGKSKDYDNYYNVISKPEGVLDVHKFQKITYSDIYPNIDIVFFVPEDKSKPVEYNFIVKPNGKIEDIQLQFKGAKTELVDNKIKINVRFGEMEETIPMSWAENDKKAIAISYKKISKNVYGFDSPENIANKTIVIDPTPNRLWGTYFGGDGADRIYETEIDSDGFLYAAGSSSSFNVIATAGSHQSNLWPWDSPNIVNSDCFIDKFDTNGNRIWGTYLGGNVQDDLGGLAIDKLNNIIVTGTTNSNFNSLTTSGAYQTSLHFYYPGNPNNFDAFLVKLSPSGQMIWGTLYGGNLTDTSNAVATDEYNNIVIGGITFSMADIATPGAHKTVFDNDFNSQYDGYIAKFTPNGQRIFGTYYGGNMQEQIKDLKIDTNNNIYVTGVAYSINGIATPGSFQSVRNPNWDGFLTKFSGLGVQIWGTYFGGESEDYFNKLKLGNNSIYVVGKTASDTSIASPGAFLSTGPTVSNGGYDGLMAKFDFDGHRLWSTYFYEPFADLDLDTNENIYAVGYTQIDNNIATANAYDSTRDIGDALIQKFTTSGMRVWGTYYGGSSFDEAYAISFDKINTTFYVAGYTMSSNSIASPGAFQMNQSVSSVDGFMAKFKECQSLPQATSNNPCIGSNLNLTASGGTGYVWSGPNGFSSNQQNPTINSVTATQSGSYSCAITGTGGCDGTVSINVLVGDAIKPVPNVTTLSTINGDCNTIVSTIPTATDNCAGVVNGTTTDPLSYSLPGNYSINWSYNDGNGNIETQTQNVIIAAVALPILVSPHFFCIQNSATINDIIITGQNIKWYDAANGGNLLANSTILQDGITYYASQTINGCESSRVAVTITIQNTLAPTGNSPQSLCSTQNPTLNNIVVNGIGIKWYSNTSSTVEIPLTTVLSDNTTYYATQTINGCESVSRLPITINLISALNGTNYATTICDDGNDGTEVVTLSDYDSFLINSTGNTFTYYKSYNGAQNQIAGELFTVNHNLITGLNTTYVRIDSSNGCHLIVELQLTLVNEPIITIPDEIPLCENKSIIVDAGSGFDSYTWSTGVVNTNSIVITQAGNYYVTVTQNHGAVVCSLTKNFNVLLSNAPIIESIDTVDWTDNQNSITVNLNATSIGDYEYSLDGITYQNSPIFNGLLNGYYIVTVRDKNGCGVAVQEVFLLSYPHFFTPNNDGHNDNWRINFSQYEPNFNVKIFDRLGKLIKVMNNFESWDGTCNGKLMPADDYWFSITREDGKIHKGHFAMKR